MNWRHLQAFVWLRWRLLANGWRRSGTLNFVVMMILAVCALLSVVPLFLGCFLAGLYAFADASPEHLLYAWDVVVMAFAFVWGMGLMVELQRTEAMSLSNFLHLPVSVNGVFAINYLSSLVRLSVVLIAPVMLGLGLGLALAKGGLLLVALPLSAAFLLMTTALTYQFQGWLASLMSNPRRRRTVVVVATTAFVLVFQLPNLLNVFGPWRAGQFANRSQELVEGIQQLDRQLAQHEIDAAERARRGQELLEQYQRETDQAVEQAAHRWQQWARLLNQVLPLGWLPLGVMAAADGNLAPAALGFLGMSLIGGVSLWRAYRTTVRIYRGEFTARGRPPRTTAAAPAGTAKPKAKAARLLEARLPGVSEPVSAVALAGLCSLLRSPEAKMMLLTPVLLGFVFGGAVFRQPADLPAAMRMLIAFGAMVMVLFSMLQLMANQFGFDRDGFRVLVLSAAKRRDILLGKNLAFAPLACGMAAVLLALLQAVIPLRLDHLLAAPAQFVAMYLLFCLLTNGLSIYAPMRIAAGSLKPAQPTTISMLLQMAAFTLLFPLLELPTLMPLGAEAALVALGWIGRAPVCLLLTLIQCAATIFLYRVGLNWQGRLLQAREQRILASVTNRAS